MTTTTRCRLGAQPCSRYRHTICGTSAAPAQSAVLSPRALAFLSDGTDVTAPEEAEPTPTPRSARTHRLYLSAFSRFPPLPSPPQPNLPPCPESGQGEFGGKDRRRENGASRDPVGGALCRSVAQSIYCFFPPQVASRHGEQRRDPCADIMKRDWMDPPRGPLRRGGRRVTLPVYRLDLVMSRDKYQGAGWACLYAAHPRRPLESRRAPCRCRLPKADGQTAAPGRRQARPGPPDPRSSRSEPAPPRRACRLARQTRRPWQEGTKAPRKQKTPVSVRKVKKKRMHAND